MSSAGIRAARLSSWLSIAVYSYVNKWICWFEKKCYNFQLHNFCFLSHFLVFNIRLESWVQWYINFSGFPRLTGVAWDFPREIEELWNGLLMDLWSHIHPLRPCYSGIAFFRLRPSIKVQVVQRISWLQCNRPYISFFSNVNVFLVCDATHVYYVC